MKKLPSVLLVFSLLFMLTSCSSSAEPSQESNGQSANNTLIVYFSRWGNTEYPSDVDATTSASIVVDDDIRYGTTEYIANMIAEKVGGDLHRIETATPYTADFDELRDVNHDEMNQNFLPELKKSNLDVSAYDTVFVGYPVWATDVPNARDTVAAWLTDIGISESKEQTEIPIRITVGDVTLDGVLYDTELAEEIKAYFPLTISMVGYGGREYYGGVDFYPEHLEGGQKNFENGDITYCEAHHNMAIFYAQTDNPTLSVDVIPIGRVPSDLSVFDSLDSREEITLSLAESNACKQSLGSLLTEIKIYGGFNDEKNNRYLTFFGYDFGACSLRKFCKPDRAAVHRRKFCGKYVKH